MNKNTLLITIISAFYLTGCASITKDVNQPIKVETYANNKMVEGAKCTGKNERGETAATTPGNLVVHRSGQNLNVTCDKDGIKGFATLISRANGGMFGNILFGGGIGAIIGSSVSFSSGPPSFFSLREKSCIGLSSSAALGIMTTTPFPSFLSLLLLDGSSIALFFSAPL